MYCTFCGTELPDNARFCPTCGNHNDKTAETAENAHHQSEGIVSKNEYFTNHCSSQARKLIRAAWIVFIICSIIGFMTNLLYLTSDFAAGKTTGSTVYVDGEEFSAENTTSVGIMEFLESLRENAPSQVYSIFVFLIIVLELIALVAIFLGFLACVLKNTGLAISYLVLSFFSVSLGKQFDVISAICVLIFMCLINKEYKRYVREHR